jgi:O-antigen/teichoic acid export membrane protein
MLITSGIPLIQMLRAVYRFPACRPRIAYLFDKTYLRNLFQFVGWKFYGMTCVVLRTQGSPVLVNLFFGPQVNAAFSIAQRVSTQASSLSAAMANAFQPAITAMEGGGDRRNVIDTSFQVCKFGSLLVLLFALPLMLEMETVLRLWLREPPPFTQSLCIWMLIMLLIDNLTFGHMIAIGARGKIAAYELVQGTTLFLAVPLLWLFSALGMNPNAVGYSLLATMAVYSANRLLFGKWLIGMSITRWFRFVGAPIALIIFCSILAGWGVMHLAAPGPLRILTTSLACSTVVTVLGWTVVLTANERTHVRQLVARASTRFGFHGTDRV